MSSSGEKSGRVKVFLVDDHPVVREGVRTYLTNRGLAVVGDACDAMDALRRVKKLAPDVVVLDINLPDIDGGELARRLRRLVPNAKLIAFSMHSSVEYVVKMARCGVHGYVTKDQPAGELFDAIQDVCRGGLHFPAGTIDELLTPPETGAAPSGLTTRELEVLTFLSEGFSNKGIAARLGINVRTVETHRENLTHKLNIQTVAGLTKYAILRGLTLP